MKAVFRHGQLQLHSETVVLVGIISPVIRSTEMFGMTSFTICDYVLLRCLLAYEIRSCLHLLINAEKEKKEKIGALKLQASISNHDFV